MARTKKVVHLACGFAGSSRDGNYRAKISCVNRTILLKGLETTSSFTHITCPECAAIEILKLEAKIKTVKEQCGLDVNPIKVSVPLKNKKKFLTYKEIMQEKEARRGAN